MKRRDFLAASASLGLLACGQRAGSALPPGQLLGPRLDLGHRLRGGNSLPAPSEQRRVGALIVGAGMAGLSCAWWLQRQGEQDFALLELENEAGGNARAGRNAVSAYPWGAHYLPIPGEEAIELRQMLAEFGALQGDPAAAQPRYQERYLCHSPQERLYIHGRWQEGLLPQFGLAAGELAEQQRFLAQMAELKLQRDAQGQRRFTVPSARGMRRDGAEVGQSMYDWLHAHGYRAPSLHWWVNYGCRDDYGTDYRHTSAWAGLHYFASRHGLASNAGEDEVLTWPEGNAWLTRRMAERLGERLITGALVWRVAEVKQGMQVDVYLPAEQRSVRYLADKLVWAGQLGFLPHLWPSLPTPWRAACAALDYAPWLVANLTLRQPPAERGGANAPPSWDNVLYQSQGLGYIDARHQDLSQHHPATVLSYYRPLSEASPRQARQQLLATSQADWAAQILRDLAPAHPDLAQHCVQLDVWRWGHAMVRPTPALLAGPALASLRVPQGRVMLAHSDLSGFSLAEEAHYWGVRAARWLGGERVVTA